MPEITTKELAAILGITPRAVNQAVARGVLLPSRIHRSKGNFFDQDRAVKRFNAQRIAPGNVAPVDGTASEKYSAARAEDKALSAKLKALDLQQKRGELVRADDVRRDAAEFMAVLKSALYAIPDRVAPQFGEHQTTLYAVLTREINHGLEAARDEYLARTDPEEV